MRYLVFVLLLTGCAYAPELGTTEQSFRAMAALNAQESYRFVAAQDNTRVYELDRVFYYFVDGVLDHVDQGQLYQQRVEITVQ